MASYFVLLISVTFVTAAFNASDSLSVPFWSAVVLDRVATNDRSSA